MVRCGHCLTPFNAAEHLDEARSAPAGQQLAAEHPPAQPAALPELEISFGTAPSETALTAASADAALPVSAVSAQAESRTPVAEQQHAPQETASPVQAETLHDDLFPHAPPSWRVPEPKSPYRPLWLLGSLLLLSWLLLQLAVFFRSDLAVRLPAAKPLLSRYCQLIGCQVDLPRRPELLSIEASELEPVNPERAEIVVLDALLHNLAPFAQTYPNLELTLADAQGTPLGRRIFRPADYLSQAENAEFGIAPKQEVAVRLYLNTSDLKPEGYRIALFYPK